MQSWLKPLIGLLTIVLALFAFMAQAEERLEQRQDTMYEQLVRNLQAQLALMETRYHEVTINLLQSDIDHLERDQASAPLDDYGEYQQLIDDKLSELALAHHSQCPEYQLISADTDRDS